MVASVQTEIGIMIGILVGAWIAKVAAVSIYMVCNKRRRRRMQEQQDQFIASSGKRTPDDVIKALPVMPYAKVVQLVLFGIPPTLPPREQQPTEVSNAPEQRQQQYCQRASSPAVSHSSNQATEQLGGCFQAHAKHHRALSHPFLISEPPALVRSQSAELGRIPPIAQHTCSAVASTAQQPSRQSSTTLLQQTSRHSSTSLVQLSRQSSANLIQQPSRQSSTKDSCPICFWEYEATSLVKQLPCGHFYHAECIDKWLVRDNSCPLCKRAVWVPPISNSGPSTGGQATVLAAAAATAPGTAVSESLDGSLQMQQGPWQQDPAQQPVQIVVVGRGD